ncbi:hypothetical protein J4558_19475 [Leptolyngbya sp. 15MV]|nr:hypothetical protein J4558_19475 [Leptolyngbya sp. 15MV]
MRAYLVLPFLLLAGCGEEPVSEEERLARVAEIERVNRGVPLPASPEPIHYPDMEKHELLGASCAFAPDGGGLAPIVLAMDDAAWMKMRGEIEQFAPDPGVQKGPSVAWTKYDGREHSLRLGLGQEIEGATSPTGKRYEATLELRDGRDRTVYEARGFAQCPG